MTKRILLINPWIHDFSAFDLWMKPLGLLYLGSILRENGFIIDFINCLDPYHPDLKSEPQLKLPKRKFSGKGHFPRELISKPSQLRDVRRRYYRFGISPNLFHRMLLEKPRPDLILITSMMTYWYPGLFETIKMIREAFPATPLILGGNYPSLCEDHARTYSGADEIIKGEGEAQLDYLLEKYLNCHLSQPVDSMELDNLPYPAFDLLRYIDQVPIMTSRGCPFDCTYCASGILNPGGFRTRNPIKVADEIEYWHKRFGVRHFSFYDDALLMNSGQSIIPLLKEVIRRGLDCEYHCPNGLHLREISFELADLMYRAGFKTLRFGFETADAVRQTTMGDKANGEHLREALRFLTLAGFDRGNIGIYLLCGLPGQEYSEIYNSIEFVKSFGARPILTEYSPLPGTALWKESIKSSDWDIAGDPLFHNNTLLSCRDSSLSEDLYQNLKQMTRVPVPNRS